MNAERVLAELIGRLTPVHEAAGRFAAGGPQCSREIERMRDELLFVERRLRELEDATGHADEVIAVPDQKGDVKCPIQSLRRKSKTCHTPA